MQNFGTSKEKLQQFDPRYDLWQNSIECIKNTNKIIGTGVGDRYAVFEENHQKAEFKKYYYPTSNSHNNFMDTQLELGAIGVFLLLGILFPRFPKNLDIKSRLFVVYTNIILILFMLIETIGNTNTTTYLLVFIIFIQSLVKETYSKKLFE
jgi:hypothetical protein